VRVTHFSRATGPCNRDAGRTLRAAMIQRDEAPTGVMGGAARGFGVGGQTPQPPVDPHAVTLLDLGRAARYELREVLGEGGMGEVRLCRDRRMGREVAMKVMHAEQAVRADLRTRFLREARVQGQLEHPAIVPVYDLGLAEDGASHFTMKRVRGVTLAAAVAALASDEPGAAERFSRRRLLGAFVTVCQAVDYAHTRGVVHRDLKPENVMLGAFGEVYVLDWGVARLVGVDDPDAPEGRVSAGPRGLTDHGVVVGTPGFMAPEQLRGEAVDARTDVYALGAVLFELLTLQPLHPYGTAEAAITSTLQGADARASVRTPDRGIAPELDALCVRATALDPAARFPSARALHEAVDAYLDGDRDLALRRSLADTHAARAEALAAEALHGGDGALDARRGAMQEVGRALAFSPEHPTALGTMLRLLSEPPAVVPAEAEEALEASQAVAMRAGNHAGGKAYLISLGSVPFLLWMGIREWSSLVMAATLLLAASAVCFWVARQTRPSMWSQRAAMIAGILASLATLRVFGPWMLLPCMVTANALLFALTPAAARYRLGTAVGCLAIAVPAVLEHLGVASTATEFVGGTIQIVPRMTELPVNASFVFLLVSHLAMVVMTTTLMDRFRRMLLDAQRQVHLQAWQLRALVPAELRAVARASTAPPAPEAACALDPWAPR
jgi:tRNA A-37 threonylcarbamoyl transferase component Bud32